MASHGRVELVQVLAVGEDPTSYCGRETASQSQRVQNCRWRREPHPYTPKRCSNACVIREQAVEERSILGSL